jgi:hypothetical protein
MMDLTDTNTAEPRPKSTSAGRSSKLASSTTSEEVLKVSISEKSPVVSAPETDDVPEKAVLEEEAEEVALLDASQLRLIGFGALLVAVLVAFLFYKISKQKGADGVSAAIQDNEPPRASKVGMEVAPIRKPSPVREWDEWEGDLDESSNKTANTTSSNTGTSRFLPSGSNSAQSILPSKATKIDTESASRQSPQTVASPYAHSSAKPKKPQHAISPNPSVDLFAALGVEAAVRGYSRRTSSPDIGLDSKRRIAIDEASSGDVEIGRSWGVDEYLQDLSD